MLCLVANEKEHEAHSSTDDFCLWTKVLSHTCGLLSNMFAGPVFVRHELFISMMVTNKTFSPLFPAHEKLYWLY